MLVVGMDGQSLMGGGATGLGRYTRSLIDAFDDWGGEVKVVLYQPKGKKYQSGFKSTFQRIMWDQYGVVTQAMSDKLDVFHSPCFSLPAILKFPRVITIHDLIVLKRPRFMTGPSRYYFSKVIPWSVKYADHIITNSDTTRKDVIKYLRVPETKVTALPLAPTLSREEIIPMDIVNSFQSKFKIHGPYVLFVGSFEYRKNIETLITQFKRVNREYPEMKLVLVGGKNQYQEKIKSLVQNKGMLEKVVFTDYLNRRQLMVAYRGSAVAVCPSLDEGFGLPVVDAMEMGTPVIASKIPAHVESAGGAAMFFDLIAEGQLGDNMLKIISDNDFRNKQIQKGNERVRQLSWNVHARKTVEIYYKVVNEARKKRKIKERKGHG
ncbi:glycosyltransferase family 4 protein [bacterium]|nr:glycosyltransferase family 4 protein [bacterium]MBU1024474.1 glycosyltransferase family 4 protein [bacterium]